MHQPCSHCDRRRLTWIVIIMGSLFQSISMILPCVKPNSGLTQVCS